MAETLEARDADPGLLMMVAAVLLVGVGASAVISAGQFLGWWYLGPAEKAVVWTELALGVAALAAARGVWDGRPWGAILGTVVAPMLAVGGAVWAVWCLANLSFSLYLLLLPPLAGLASCVVPFTIPLARKCARARVVMEAKLRDAGVFGR